MLLPVELGLPRKFTAFRSGQYDMALAVATSDKRFTLLSAPTGCVSGDTQITVSRGSLLRASKKTTVEREFVLQYNPRRREYPTLTRSHLGHKIGLNTLNGVAYNGPAQTFELVLQDGSSLRATSNHPILTTNGWVELCSMAGTAKVICDGGIPYGRKTDKPIYRQVQGLKYHPYSNSARSLRSRNGWAPEGVLFRVPYHRLVVEASINGLSVLELVQICRKEPDIASALTFLDPGEIAIHHRDGDYTNNRLDNLEALSHGDHAKIHDCGRRLDAHPREVSIRRLTPHRVEDTYDLICADPHNSFVANGIVVHNTGKSLVYLSVAQLTDARTLILTGTKGLQQQLSADFASIGMRDVRGQNNYRCVALDAVGGHLVDYGRAGANCDEGPCHIGVLCDLKRDGGCTYYDQVKRCADARLVITNYSYWLTAGRFADPDALGAFDLLILDEAHSAPDHLSSFCAVALDAQEVHALLKRDLPPLNEGVEVWVYWAREALAECRELYTTARQAMISIGGDKRTSSRRMKRLQDLGHRLKDLAGAHEWRRGEPSAPDVYIPGTQTDWVAEKTDTGALFSPVWAHAYAEEYLFRGIPKVVLTSATLQRAVARYLGVDDAAMDYREFSSAFDPSRRPLIYIPTTTVDRNMTEGQVRIWINRIDGIIDGRPDRKGIIHTRSYDRAQLILQRSRHGARLIGHDRRGVRDAVERFKRSSTGVLVSPSVEEGYDFPGDQCRYQILAKVPFVDTRSLILQARHKSDKTYLNYLTALSIVQQVGRGMRAAEDFCESFIIDDHWAWSRAAMVKQNLFPKWFRAAWRDSQQVPAPPPLRG